VKKIIQNHSSLSPPNSLWKFVQMSLWCVCLVPIMYVSLNTDQIDWIVWLLCIMTLDSTAASLDIWVCSFWSQKSTFFTTKDIYRVPKDRKLLQCFDSGMECIYWVDMRGNGKDMKRPRWKQNWKRKKKKTNEGRAMPRPTRILRQLWYKSYAKIWFSSFYKRHWLPLSNPVRFILSMVRGWGVMVGWRAARKTWKMRALLRWDYYGSG